MDWNLKIPSWDFTEFEQGTIPNIDSSTTTTSSSSCYGGQGIKGNFSVDLKLGQVIDSGGRNPTSSSSSSKMALSPSSSSKRPRPVIPPTAAAGCLVDGCNADLTNCKEYHRRHKVCEVHSKTAQVSINGQKQRFCQQCSRFHSLEEFDEGKRSCRKRLDGHNRRRRKPQPDTSRGPSLFSGHQGATMLQFSSPHVYQTTSLTNQLWTTMIKSEEQTYSTRNSSVAHKQNLFPESSSGGKKLAGKQPFNLFHGSHLKLQTSPPKVSQQSQSQSQSHPQPQTVLNFEGNSSSSSYEKLFCDGYPPPARVVQPVVQSSDCALSLLSSSPSQTSCTTLNHVMHPSNSYGAPPNPMDPGAGYGGLASIMDPNGNDCNGMIQMGIHHHHQHASPDNEAPQTLPFYWE